MKTDPKIENATESILGTKFEGSPPSLSVSIPLRTVSEGNTFEHWTKRHKRHSLQKKAVYIALKARTGHISLPCHIKLTRLAPRRLDRWDNLPMALKYILDACCEVITKDFRPGRADGDDRITVSYDQLHSRSYGVKIEITNDKEFTNVDPNK